MLAVCTINLASSERKMVWEFTQQLFLLNQFRFSLTSPFTHTHLPFFMWRKIFLVHLAPSASSYFHLQQLWTVTSFSVNSLCFWCFLRLFIAFLLFFLKISFSCASWIYIYCVLRKKKCNKRSKTNKQTKKFFLQKEERFLKIYDWLDGKS